MKFCESWPQQNPVLYGNKNQAFFREVDSDIGTISIMITSRDRNLQLQAGQAHGACNGDRFRLCSLDATEHHLQSQRDPIIARIANIRALTSDLELVGIITTHIPTGWVAKPLTRLLLRQFSIRIASELQDRDALRMTLKETSFSIDEHEGPSFSFHIILNHDKEYEIRDKSDRKIVNLPSMMQDQTDISFVYNVIHHLAKFELVRDLANQTIKVLLTVLFTYT
jgi:hypothetical protein